MSQVLNKCKEVSDQAIENEDTKIQDKIITIYCDVELIQQKNKLIALGPIFHLWKILTITI